MTNRQFKNGLNSEIKFLDYFYQQYVVDVREEAANTVLNFKYPITSSQKDWLQRRFTNGVYVIGDECVIYTPNLKSLFI